MTRWLPLLLAVSCARPEPATPEPTPDEQAAERERQRKAEDLAIVNPMMEKVRAESDAAHQEYKRSQRELEEKVEQRRIAEAARKEEERLAREAAEEEEARRQAEAQLAEALANDPTSPDYRAEFAEHYEKGLLDYGIEIHDIRTAGDFWDVLHIDTPHCSRQLVYQIASKGGDNLRKIGFVAVTCGSASAAFREEL